MVGTRGRGRGKGEKNEGGAGIGEDGGGNRAEYEASREQRIKENAERMKSLGILHLAEKLKRRTAKPSPSSHKAKPSPAPSNDPPRRSSRLKEIPPVSYAEKKPPKKERSSPKNVEIHIPEGENPEIYTEEHEKLLGDSEAVWVLYSDGYDEDGQRIYDPDQGKSCHQCRQKTLGHHTQCSKCEIGLGQFCGDCLYMRYGENVIEVNQKSDWICPVCRGICNCSRCRRDKGFAPTGAIYRKVVQLGYKSVAHYLIQTRREKAMVEVGSAEKSISGDGSSPSDDGDQEGSDAVSLPLVDDKNKDVEDDMEVDIKEEHKVDDQEEGVDNENATN